MATEITNYSKLRPNRIRKILLICSSYDSFTLEEDGLLESQINNEYSGLNLSSPPEFVKVNSTLEAYKVINSGEKIDLIIMMFNASETDSFDFANDVKSLTPNLPIVLLSHFSREITLRLHGYDLKNIDYVFCWLGNADLILAIIKLIEDNMNIDVDCLEYGVQAILLVEDSIHFYSTYLPLIYRLIFKQSIVCMTDALNEQQQMSQRRARPRILFARTYNEAEHLYKKYRNNLLGVISDVTFKITDEEEEEEDAGIYLTELIQKDNPQLPIILQSSRHAIAEKAKDLEVGFIHKHSKTLTSELSEIIQKEFLFGKLVLQNPDKKSEIYEIDSLAQLQNMIEDINLEFLIHHTAQNKLSKWLFARGIFSLAKQIRDINYDQFDNLEDFRESLLQNISDYRILLGQDIIAEFNESNYNKYMRFSRIGGGSLGGKARGLAFISRLIHQNSLYDKYEDVRIGIPRTVVIATDYFDEFIAINGLQYVINSDISDDDILSEFVGSRLPEKLMFELKAYLKTITKPIVIRSSSKLEDSYYQPFAGVYSTYMIPCTDNKDQLLRMLGKAIKSVYASVYYAASRAYVTATSNVISEEKMAVILQEVCGSEDQHRFFPTMSGVGRSINFYPIEDEKPEDGIVNLAFGLGKIVVDGGQTLRFSPKHPKKILQLSNTIMTLSETQREFYALDLSPESFKTSTDDSVNLEKIKIATAESFRNTKYVTSTFDRMNNLISESSYAKGSKVATFSNILKYDQFPLAEILSSLLEIGRNEMKTEVEIEFAVDMDVPKGKNKKFKLLQIRPIVASADSERIDWNEMEKDKALVYAESALGLGSISGVTDLIYIKESVFNAALTEEMAEEIEAYNRKLNSENIYYVLIGPGRWGSTDPWLGIPVKWSAISNARVIVESGLENFRIEPSQGTHFFQNMTSLGVAYMTLNPYINDGIYDIEALNAHPSVYEGKYFIHIRFEKELYIFVDGRENKGIIKKAE